jgi:hypothetical protein
VHATEACPALTDLIWNVQADLGMEKIREHLKAPPVEARWRTGRDDKLVRLREDRPLWLPALGVDGRQAIFAEGVTNADAVGTLCQHTQCQVTCQNMAAQRLLHAKANVQSCSGAALLMRCLGLRWSSVMLCWRSRAESTHL